MSTRIKWILIGSATLLVVALGVLLKISRPVSLPRDEAERLLRESDFLKETRPLTLTLFFNRWFPEADLRKEHPEVEPFIRAGLVEVLPHTVIGGIHFGAKFALTDEGEKRAFSEKWQRTSGPSEEEAWILVIAHKNLETVSEPVTTKDRAECDFAWKWNPADPSLDLSDKIETALQASHATFQLVNDYWLLDAESLK